MTQKAKGLYNKGTKVNTISYGEAEIIAYDPRYPGTYTIKTFIKGHPKTIHNVPKREIICSL